MGEMIESLNEKKLKELNDYLRNKSPKAIIEWALFIAERPIVTTNFKPFSASLLHAISNIKKDIKTIWCDTGYNTRNTYLHAEVLISKLSLNIFVYAPKQTTGYRDSVLGMPEVDTPEHDIFTDQVKLEPFKRALKEHNPDVWFTNLRKGQTAHRDSLDIVTKDKNGIIKVCPFYYWSDAELENYLIEYKLPNEYKYFDPTKVLANRECGLHV